MTSVLLLVSAALWLLLMWLGMRQRTVLGVLVAGVALYGFLDYVVRPAVLVEVQPKSTYGDPIADPRIDSQYVTSVGNMLRAILPGVVVLAAGLALALYLTARRAKRAGTGDEPAAPQQPVATLPLWTLFAVGWLFRLLSYANSSSTVLGTLAILPAVTVGYYIVYKPITFRLVLLFAGSELLWSILGAEKAPILAVMLWLLIRQIARRGRKVPWRRVLVTLLAAFLAFLAVTEVKVAAGRLNSSTKYEATYPAPIQPLLPVVARFDSFFQFTDAYLADPHSWLSPAQVGEHFVKTLVPSFALPAADRPEIAGSLWEPGVRAQTLSNLSYSANFSEGTFAEGWAVDGQAGSILENLLLVGFILFAAACFDSRRRFPQLFVVAFTTQPYLFERGMMGIGEGIGKSLELAIIASVVIGADAALARRRSWQQATATATPAAPRGTDHQAQRLPGRLHSAPGPAAGELIRSRP